METKELKPKTKQISYLKNWIKLMDKVDKDKSYKPTKEELQGAYGYLDYCSICGKRFLPLESSTHSFIGNSHKFGCSIVFRLIGIIYSLISIPLKLLMFIIIAPFYFGWLLIKKILGIIKN